MKDDLGKRMKDRYEFRTRVMLPRRTNTIIRLDGKAFHTYTRGRERPFDEVLHRNMARAAQALCADAMGARLAYVQSDEISVLLTDYTDLNTEAWFDGNVQKIVSVSASIVTEAFNDSDIMLSGKHAHFDARVFTIPDPIEVHNYFVWRQKDAERNSLSMLAQAHYSHRELHGKRRQDLHDMLHEKGVNWNDMPAAFKRGTAVDRSPSTGLWTPTPAPIFAQDMTYIADHLPVMTTPQGHR